MKCVGWSEVIERDELSQMGEVMGRDGRSDVDGMMWIK